MELKKGESYNIIEDCYDGKDFFLVKDTKLAYTHTRKNANDDSSIYFFVTVEKYKDYKENYFNAGITADYRFNENDVNTLLETNTERRKRIIKQILKEEDFYNDVDGLMVFSEKYHLKRGYCCNNKCKHCPY